MSSDQGNNQARRWWLRRIARWTFFVMAGMTGYAYWSHAQQQAAYRRLEAIAKVTYAPSIQISSPIRQYIPHAMLRLIPRVPYSIHFRRGAVDLASNVRGIPIHRVYHIGFADCQVSPAQLDDLALFPDLLSVSFYRCQFPEGGMATLPSLNRVVSLTIHSCSVSSTDMIDYAHLPALKHLSLTDTNAGDSMLRGIAGHVQLGTIELIRTSITDDGLREIRSLPQLDTLHLGHTRVTGVGLATLNSPLRQLNMAGTQASDDGMSAISQIPSLQSLDLARTKVTVLGVSRLRRLPVLDYLILDRCDVGDEVLPHLRAISSLKRWRGVKTRMVEQTTLP